MKLYDLVNEPYESIDDLTVALGEAITEVQELEQSRDDYRDEVARLEDEVANLKEKNLQMLAMVSTVAKEENKQSTEEVEEMTISDVYKEV